MDEQQQLVVMQLIMAGGNAKGQRLKQLELPKLVTLLRQKANLKKLINFWRRLIKHKLAC